MSSGADFVIRLAGVWFVASVAVAADGFYRHFTTHSQESALIDSVTEKFANASRAEQLDSITKGHVSVVCGNAATGLNETFLPTSVENLNYAYAQGCQARYKTPVNSWIAILPTDPAALLAQKLK